MTNGAKTLERIRYSVQVEGTTPTYDRPLTVALHEEHTGVEAEVCAYDSLGVALHGLTVWGDNRAASLETLAKTISERVTYLWEPLALIERDLEREQVQMRSAPPLIEDKAIEFYEGQLTRQAGSPRIHMARYRRENGQARRVRVPVILTHAIFRRLVDDLSTILRAPETE